MQITFRKTGERTLETVVLRDDRVGVQMRSSYGKLPLPHDLVHYVVEFELKLKHGFWGCIEEGALFPGMTVVSGRPPPDARKRSNAVIRAAYQQRNASEGLVEAFVAAAYAVDPALRFAKLVSSDSRGLWSPALIDKDSRRRIVERLLIAQTRWQDLAIGESITLPWPPSVARTRRPSSSSRRSLRRSG